jgi:P4 family phage/plasmid primase-like protien
MRREVVAGNYVEIDMCNAHPRLLASLRPDNEAFAKYLNDRDSCLEDVMATCGVEKWQAKSLYIRMAFGGKVETWMTDNNVSVPPPLLVKHFEDAVDDFVTDIRNDDEYSVFYKAAQRNHKPNPGFGALALYLQDLESKAMLSLMSHLEIAGVTCRSLIHDGVLVDKGTSVDLHAISEAVSRDTGIDCVFAIKALDEPDWEDIDFVKNAYSWTTYDPATSSRKEEVEDLILAAASGTHADVAAAFHAMNPDVFMYTGSKEGWYKFSQPRWHEEGKECLAIGKLINGRLYDNFLEQAASFEQRAKGEEGDADKKDGFLAMAGALRAVAKQLKNSNFKKSLLEELKILYSPSEPAQWVNSLNSKNHILGLEDGVYDYSTGEFRAGTPCDLVSLSTGHTIASIRDATPENIAKAHGFVDSCFIDSEMAEYKKMELAYGLAANPVCQRVLIATGRGCNGKSQLANHIGKAFGKYFYAPDISLLMRRGTNKDSIMSPQAVNLKNKRWVVASEPETEDGIRAGFIKALVAGDSIQARGLYKEPIEFKYYGGLQICCNNMPDLTDCGFGMRRRLRVMPYEKQFVPFPDPENPLEFLMVDTPVSEGASPEHAALLRLLIDIYQASSKQKFEPPEKVKVASEDYANNSDPILLFIQDSLVKARVKDAVTPDEMFDAWRVGDHYVAARAASKHHLGKELGKHSIKSSMARGLNGGVASRAFWGWKLRNAAVAMQV